MSIGQAKAAKGIPPGEAWYEANRLGNSFPTAVYPPQTP